MNGKASKMLKKFNRTDHKSKKLFKSLTHVQRGMISAAHKTNKQGSLVDFLNHFFPKGNN